MIKILNTFQAIRDLITFFTLPKNRCSITFYSEGKSYWPHLQDLVFQTLNQNKNLEICYVSSDLKDPGLEIDHPRINKFFIGSGHLRNYFFQKLETKVLVLTMPDLHNFQLKRSSQSVHYIYVQHSLVSLHMVYRHGAFNHYDAICAAGPHHIREIRAMEKHYSLPRKKIIKLGYPILNRLIDRSNSLNQSDKNNAHSLKKIIVAPSWGQQGLIESGSCKILIERLLNLNYEVTLRPHPQTMKFAKEKINEILEENKNKLGFCFEDNTVSQDSFFHSDIMISDWSGAAIEYALGLKKPVIFVDIPRKINNQNYKEIKIEPIEVAIREKIGVIWDSKKPIKDALEKCQNFDRNKLDLLLKETSFDVENGYNDFSKHLIKITEKDQ